MTDTLTDRIRYWTRHSKFCSWHGCSSTAIKEYSVKSEGEGQYGHISPIAAGVVRQYCELHREAAIDHGFTVTELM